MKPLQEATVTIESCSCTSCDSKIQSDRQTLRRLLVQRYRINRLCNGKYDLHLRESKLLDRLVKTRALYDALKTQLLSSSLSVSSITDLKPRQSPTENNIALEEAKSSHIIALVDLVDKGAVYGSKNLSECFSCCICNERTRLHENVQKRRRNRQAHTVGNIASITTVVKSDPFTSTCRQEDLFKLQSREILKKTRHNQENTESEYNNFLIASNKHKLLTNSKLKKTHHELRRSKAYPYSYMENIGEGGIKIRKLIHSRDIIEKMQSVELLKVAQQKKKDSSQAEVKDVEKFRPKKSFMTGNTSVENMTFINEVSMKLKHNFGVRSQAQASVLKQNIARISRKTNQSGREHRIINNSSSTSSTNIEKENIRTKHIITGIKQQQRKRNKNNTFVESHTYVYNTDKHKEPIATEEKEDSTPLVLQETIISTELCSKTEKQFSKMKKKSIKSNSVVKPSKIVKSISTSSIKKCYSARKKYLFACEALTKKSSLSFKDDKNERELKSKPLISFQERLELLSAPTRFTPCQPRMKPHQPEKPRHPEKVRQPKKPRQHDESRLREELRQREEPYRRKEPRQREEPLLHKARQGHHDKPRLFNDPHLHAEPCLHEISDQHKKSYDIIQIHIIKNIQASSHAFKRCLCNLKIVKRTKSEINKNSTTTVPSKALSTHSMNSVKTLVKASNLNLHEPKCMSSYASICEYSDYVKKSQIEVTARKKLGTQDQSNNEKKTISNHVTDKNDAIQYDSTSIGIHKQGKSSIRYKVKSTSKDAFISTVEKEKLQNHFVHTANQSHASKRRFNIGYSYNGIQIKQRAAKRVHTKAGKTKQIRNKQPRVSNSTGKSKQTTVKKHREFQKHIKAHKSRSNSNLTSRSAQLIKTKKIHSALVSHKSEILVPSFKKSKTNSPTQQVRPSYGRKFLNSQRSSSQYSPNKDKIIKETKIRRDSFKDLNLEGYMKTRQNTILLEDKILDRRILRPTIKRCLCILKFYKKGTQNKKSGIETETKPNIVTDELYPNFQNRTKGAKSKHSNQLRPFESKHSKPKSIFVFRECNPYECLEKIRKQNNFGIVTQKPKIKSNSSDTRTLGATSKPLFVNTDLKKQKSFIERVKITTRKYFERAKEIYSEKSLKQGYKKSSNLSFNIKFYKGVPPEKSLNRKNIRVNSFKDKQDRRKKIKDKKHPTQIHALNTVAVAETKLKTSKISLFKKDASHDNRFVDSYYPISCKKKVLSRTKQHWQCFNETTTSGFTISTLKAFKTSKLQTYIHKSKCNSLQIEPTKPSQGLLNIVSNETLRFESQFGFEINYLDHMCCEKGEITKSVNNEIFALRQCTPKNSETENTLNVIKDETNRSELTGVQQLLKKCYYTMNVQVAGQQSPKKRHWDSAKLKDYECKPEIRIPYEYQQIIMKRLMKKVSRSSGTGNKLKTRASLTSSISSKTRKNQSIVARDWRHRATKARPVGLKYQTLPRSPRPGIQVVHVGSTSSFDIESSERSKAPTAGVISVPKRQTATKSRSSNFSYRYCKDRGINSDGIDKHHQESQSIMKEMRHRASSVTPMCLKKCFWTLKLQKKGRQQKERDLQDIHKGISTPPKFNVKKPILRTAAISQNKKTKQRFPEILPYEYEPGMCVPGIRDSYSCSDLIKKRSRKQTKNFGTDSIALRISSSSSMTPTQNRKRKQTQSRNIRVKDLKSRDPAVRYKPSVMSIESQVMRPRQAVNLVSRFRSIDDFFKVKTYTPYDVNRRLPDIYVHKAPKKVKKVSKYVHTQKRMREGFSQDRKSTLNTDSQIELLMHGQSTMTGGYPKRYCTANLQGINVDIETKARPHSSFARLKRCFCTLKMLTASRRKLIKSSNFGHERATPLVDKLVDRMQTRDRSAALIPYACEPEEQNTKINKKMLGTLRPKTKSSSSFTSSKIFKAGLAHSTKLLKKVRKGDLSPREVIFKETVVRSPMLPEANKIGSSNRFDRKFYKDKFPNYQLVQAAATMVKKTHPKKKKSRGQNFTIKTKNKGLKCTSLTDKCRECQINTTRRDIAIGPILRRCFCILKLHKQKPSKIIDQDKPTNRGSAILVIKKNPTIQTRSVMTVNKLEVLPCKLGPFKSEPGVCVPGESNPNECEKRIKIRLMNSSGTLTDRHYTKSTTSMKKYCRRHRGSIAQPAVQRMKPKRTKDISIEGQSISRRNKYTQCSKAVRDIDSQVLAQKMRSKMIGVGPLLKRWFYTFQLLKSDNPGRTFNSMTATKTEKIITKQSCTELYKGRSISSSIGKTKQYRPRRTARSYTSSRRKAKTCRETDTKSTRTRCKSCFDKKKYRDCQSQLDCMRQDCKGKNKDKITSVAREISTRSKKYTHTLKPYDDEPGVCIPAKRCFCTLTIQRAEVKSHHNSAVLRPSLPTNVKICNKKPSIEKKSNPPSAPLHQLNRHGRKPGRYVQGCNPYDYLERIKKRGIRKMSRTTGTRIKRVSEVSVSSMAQLIPGYTNRRTQLKGEAYTPQEIDRILERPRYQFSHGNTRQRARMSSNFNINVEFYKNMLPQIINKDETVCPQKENCCAKDKCEKCNKPRRFSRIGHRDIKHDLANKQSQLELVKKENNSSVVGILRRSFCSLSKLHRSHVTQSNHTQSLTVGRVEELMPESCVGPKEYWMQYQILHPAKKAFETNPVQFETIMFYSPNKYNNNNKTCRSHCLVNSTNERTKDIPRDIEDNKSTFKKMLYCCKNLFKNRSTQRNDKNSEEKHFYPEKVTEKITIKQPWIQILNPTKSEHHRNRVATTDIKNTKSLKVAKVGEKFDYKKKYSRFQSGDADNQTNKAHHRGIKLVKKTCPHYQAQFKQANPIHNKKVRFCTLGTNKAIKSNDAEVTEEERTNNYKPFSFLFKTHKLKNSKVQSLKLCSCCGGVRQKKIFLSVSQDLDFENKTLEYNEELKRYIATNESITLPKINTPEENNTLPKETRKNKQICPCCVSKKNKTVVNNRLKPRIGKKDAVRRVENMHLESNKNKRKKCVCGSSICAAETVKEALGIESGYKRAWKEKRRQKRLEKETKIREKLNKAEDKEIKKNRLITEKYILKNHKNYKNTPDAVLVAE